MHRITTEVMVVPSRIVVLIIRCWRAMESVDSGGDVMARCCDDGGLLDDE